MKAHIMQQMFIGKAGKTKDLFHWVIYLAFCKFTNSPLDFGVALSKTDNFGKRHLLLE